METFKNLKSDTVQGKKTVKIIYATGKIISAHVGADNIRVHGNIV